MGHQKPSDFDALLRNAQIIIFGLISGVVLFMVIVLVFLGARVQPFDADAVASIVMAAFAVATIPARLVVPGLVVTAACRKIAQGTWEPNRRHPSAPLPDTDEGKLLQVFMTKMIIGAALLEGGALANLMLFMLEGQVYSIVLAVVLVFGILVSFPTRTGLTEWLETQSRRLRESRL